MDSKSTAFICIFVFRGNRCDKIYSLIRFFSENTFKNNMLFVLSCGHEVSGLYDFLSAIIASFVARM